MHGITMTNPPFHTFTVYGALDKVGTQAQKYTSVCHLAANYLEEVMLLNLHERSYAPTLEQKLSGVLLG